MNECGSCAGVSVDNGIAELKCCTAPIESSIMSITTVSPQSLFDLSRTDPTVDLIDVRTPAEFREVHVAFAKNAPLEQLDPAQLAASRSGSGRPLYVICHSGTRSHMAAEKLAAAGLPHLVEVEGGTKAWDQAGLPVIRGKKTISLERQVRIAAGSLVLTGVALSLWVHPYAIGLAAFVGAGLVFAGITDTCGMGMLLARMPWNQVSSAPAAPAASCQLKSHGA